MAAVSAGGDGGGAAAAAGAAASGSGSAPAAPAASETKTIYLRDQSFKEAFDFKSAAIADAPLQPNPAVFTLPLDNEQFNVHHGLWPKLSHALSANDLNLKNQALTVLGALLRRPNAVAYALHHGFTTLLVSGCLSDADARCRQLASRALITIAQQRVGREGTEQRPGEALLGSGNAFGKALLAALSDSDQDVRLNTYAVWDALTEYAKGVDALILLHGIDVIINKAGDELPAPVKTAALQVLVRCVRVAKGFENALSSGVVIMLIRLLREPGVSTSVLSACLTCLALVAVPHSGKKWCVVSGAVPLAVTQLHDSNLCVREPAAQALMTLTIDLKAKSEALAAGAVDLLLQVIDSADTSQVLRAYALHALSHVSEANATHKSAPMSDAATRKRMEQLSTDSHPLVSAGAKCVITVLNKL